MFAFVIGFSFLFVSYAVYQRQHDSEQGRILLCQATNKSTEIMRQLVAKADASLEVPGAPGYTYYRTHPRELRAAHLANATAILSLHPIDCS